jgi:protein-disulfide isomerase
MLAQLGVTKEKFEATLKDKDLYEGVIASRKRAAEVLKVNSTPTFFVNGEKFVGESTFEAMEAVIKPLLGE